MLLIANIGDAFSPVKSAYNVIAGFEGSGVLEIAGFVSRSMPPSYTLDRVSQHWADVFCP